GGFFVGKTGSADQDQRLTLVGWQFCERLLKLLKLDVAVLLGMGLERFSKSAVAVFNLAPAPSGFPPGEVAQNREEANRRGGPGFERIDVGQRTQERLLHEIVGPIYVAGQRYGERAQARQGREDPVADRSVSTFAGSITGHSSLVLVVPLIELLEQFGETIRN